MKTRGNLWPNCSNEVKNEIKVHYYIYLMKKIIHLYVKTNDVVGMLAAKCVENNEWPELLPAMLNLYQNGDDIRRESLWMY